MRGKNALLVAILFAVIAVPAFTASSPTPKPPSLENYATGERYEKVNELKSLPPTPLENQPPKVIYTNQSLYELLSKLEGNKTRPITKDYKMGINSTAISGQPVQFVSTISQNQIEGSVAPMSHEVIDTDFKTGKRLKVSAALYKDTGEIDPKWDYYSVKVTIEDIYAKNDFWNGPLFADIYVYFPDWCDEVPTNHVPQAGWRWTEGIGSFGYKGISYNVKLPAYSISYESSKTKYKGWLYCHWSFDGAWDAIAYWYYVFKDYTEASVGVRVPQGKKPYCYVAGWAAWYRFWIFAFSFDGKEMVNWVYVDPPEPLEHPEPPIPPDEVAPTNPTGPSKSGPAPTPVYGDAVDGFLYTIAFTDKSYYTLKYTCMSGFGKDFYGWHVSDYSYVYLCAAVSKNGQPVKNALVTFYLVDPSYQVYSIGSFYTSDDGIATCLVRFNPQNVPKGLWWFIPVHGNVSDQCAFSYGYCLVITGYTTMPCWNTIYLEDAFLVPENTILELTATPPSGYKFVCWWINFYYECKDNPIYILIDFDCIVLARFELQGQGSYEGPSGSRGLGGCCELLL